MKFKLKKSYLILISLLTTAAVTISLSSCGGQQSSSGSSSGESSAAAATASEAVTAKNTTAPAASGSAAKHLSESDITVNETITNSEDGGHAVTADGESKTLSNVLVTKTGEADGDEADFYGENAAVFASNAGTLNLRDMVIKTDGTHANGVFSYGEGTTVNISDAYIKTTGNCSGGLMTTGGGTMNADNLTIETSGNSSAAIRSDRGGGTVNVTGGYYATSGKGSPVVYSTADITVSDAEMVSSASQGIVVEGKNSVTLNNVSLTADAYISSLTCDAGAINLNGHKLYVNGKEYTEGTASTGNAIELTISSSSDGGGHGAPPDGGKP